MGTDLVLMVEVVFADHDEVAAYQHMLLDALRVYACTVMLYRSSVYVVCEKAFVYARWLLMVTSSREMSLSGLRPIVMEL